mmetsp:Transcript_95644/g.265731  ORF Transcript_95644/g.265731 Transcript_95644/m.265731 type:complete len:380 (-) Transcript_95644:52-1191(-)
MPYWFALTTTSRFIVSRPPHLYGSHCGQVSSHRIATPEGEKHWPVFDAQSVKSQSEIFDGGEIVLDRQSALRSLLTAQILVYRSSWTLARKMAHCLSNSSVRSRFCSSFSFISSVSALMLEMVLARDSINFLLFSLIAVSWSLMFLFVVSYVILLLFISAVSSSTESLNFPHSNDIKSCRSPQFDSPSLHFFHWPAGCGFSETGSVSGTKTGTAVVVVTSLGVMFSCARLALLIWPRAARSAALAALVIILSALTCRAGLVKFSVSSPSPVGQIFTFPLPRCRSTPISEDSNSGTSGTSLQAETCRMKSNAARSFFRMVSSLEFSYLVALYSCSRFTSTSSVSWRFWSIWASPSAEAVRSCVSLASCEPKRARSPTTWM